MKISTKNAFSTAKRRVTSGVLSVLMAGSALSIVGTTVADAGTMSSVVSWNSSTTVSAGTTLANNTVYKVLSSRTISASTGGNALAVASGATATLYIPKGVTLTVNGGLGSGSTGGGAGILVPSSSTLIVTGGGTLTAKGGGAGNGSNGYSNQNTAKRKAAGIGTVSVSTAAGGSGGSGGGGAGAGIGTNGGTGGSPGTSSSYMSYTYQMKAYLNGNSGGNGGTGSSASSMGKLYVLGNVTVNATGGASGSAGSVNTFYSTPATSASTSMQQNYGWYYSSCYCAAGGTGGGGGAGYAAANIGNGGSGGGGGAGGGGGSSAYNYDFSYSGVSSLGSGGGGGGGQGAAVGLQGYGPSTSTGSRSTSGKSGSYLSGSSTVHGGTGGAGGGSNTNSTAGSVYVASTATLSAISSASGTRGTVAVKNTASSQSSVNYTLTYYTNFEATSTSKKTVTYGVISSAVTTVSKTGYSFKGYYTGKNGAGNQVFDEKGSPCTDTAYFDSTGAWVYNSDLTLYPYLAANKYKVTFENGEGASETESQDFQFDHLIPSISPLPTKPEFRFDGYYTSPDGEGTMVFDSNGDVVKGNEFADESGNLIYSDDFTLYAKWALEPEGDAVHSEVVYGIITEEADDYYYGNVNILINGSPANADSVSLVSGDEKIDLSPSSAGSYDYTADKSGTYDIYVNGEKTGSVLEINSTDAENPDKATVKLFAVKVSVKKNGAPVSNADITIKSDSQETALPESNTDAGTYTIVSLESDKNFGVYLDGKDTSESLKFAETGNTVEINLYETTVRTLLNTTLTDSLGDITLVNGDNVVDTTMTSTGVYVADTDEGITYDVYLNGKDTGIDVVSGESADVVYNSTFVSFTKDGESYDADRTVEIVNGSKKIELSAFNGSQNTYTIDLPANDSTVYDIFVDGTDTGYDVTSDTTTTVNYVTTTVKVTKDNKPYDADRTVTLKTDSSTVNAEPLGDSKNTYTALMLENDANDYDILIDGEQTKHNVSAGNTETVNYASVVVQLRKDGETYDPVAEITLVNGGVSKTADKVGEGKYSIISLGTDLTSYDVFVDGKDSDVDVQSGVTAYVDYTTLKVNVNKDNAPMDADGEVVLVNGDYSLAPEHSSTGVYEIVQPNADKKKYDVVINDENVGKTVSVENSTAEVNYFTLTLDKNVSDDVECIIYPSEQIVKLENSTFNLNEASANVPNDKTMRFIGWYTQAEGGTKVDSFTFDKTTTLYAHYSDSRNYIVNYNIMSQSDHTDYIRAFSVTKLAAVGSDPIIDDYLNDGPCLKNEHLVASTKKTEYYTTDGGTTETVQTVAEDDSLEIDVYYDLESYDVIYNVNGKLDRSEKAYYGDEITVAAPSDPDYEYKVFSDWSDNDGNTYKIGDTVEVTGEITLNATLETSSIVYKLNEGVYDGKADDVTVNDLLLDHEYDLIVPTRDEYKLTGWTDADGNVYPAGEKFTVTQQNTVLTAQWEHVDHHYNNPVWYWYRDNPKDKYHASASTECSVCGHAVKDMPAEVTYQDNANGTQTAIAKVVIDGSEWTSEFVFVSGYTVTVENGYADGGLKDYYTVGDVVTVYAKAVNENNEKFAGWYIDDGDNNRDNDQLLSNNNAFAFYVRSNMNIYAKYEAKPEVSPLAFSVQGGTRTRIAGQNKTTSSITVRWELTANVDGTSYQMVDAGVLRSYNVSGENLNLDNVDNNNVRKQSAPKKPNLGTFTYTLNMSAASSAKSYNVRGFAVYKNTKTGETFVVYSDPIHNDPYKF